MRIITLTVVLLLGIIFFRITMDDIFNSQQNGVRLIDEWDKCNFCKNYDDFEGCDDWYCDSRSNFELSQDKVIEKAKQKEISCADVIILMEG